MQEKSLIAREAQERASASAAMFIELKEQVASIKDKYKEVIRQRVELQIELNAPRQSHA